MGETGASTDMRTKDLSTPGAIGVEECSRRTDGTARVDGHVEFERTKRVGCPTPRLRGSEAWANWAWDQVTRAGE